MSWLGRLERWAPVRLVHVERVAFDTHAMSAGRELEGTEYQRGTLQGVETRQYLLEKWGRACAYCGASGVPLNIDHVHPRSANGSDRIDNLVIACVPCNQSKGDRPVHEFLADRPAALKRVLAQIRTPLRDAAAVNATRWALWREVNARWPAASWSGGRTKWNRVRNALPKSHTLDALAVGEFEAIEEYPGTLLVACCSGRGSYSRTSSDRYGFPRLRLPRHKRFFGYSTGDLVRAVVPSGKRMGTYSGRVAVRSSGSFNITTARGTVQGIHHRHVRLLQRGDGYGYAIQKEEGCDPSVR